ncbi:MAG: ferrous iron transport protein B [Epulopiscium sp. Nele67-Bin005]|nr:MAG: ferrous iron transport protein B [Epulopiscium sp. Nele67-Bin005]
MKIALAGNPNSGKTTLYNALTGELAQVGNWAGVTVEKRVANLKDTYSHNNEDVQIVDLPGAYSISAYTNEEAITNEFVKNENPDVIINIIDSTNLSRSLFFTTQLLELNIPIVVALNKNDLLEKKEISINNVKLAESLGAKVVQISALEEKGLKALTKTAIKLVSEGAVQKPVSNDLLQEVSSKEQETELNKKRFEIISEIVKNCEVKQVLSKEKTTSDKIDEIVAHKVWGLPIFFVIMWGVYWFSQSGLGGFLSEYVNEELFGEIIPDMAEGFFESLNTNPFLQDLLIEGMIGGVGAILGFLPLIMVLFFCLSLLEDCGYMARVAVVMDRYFKKIGLSGKSIIPMVVGSGCAIPGIMATRTIENEHERRMASILTPFVPCGAKLPIIALFATVFFPNSSWVAPSIYIISIGVIVCVGLILKKIYGIENNNSLFIIELAEYKVPSIKNAVKNMLHKSKHFIVKAGTIILLCNTLVWLLQSYDFSFNVVDDADLSMLATIGGLFAPLFIPLGMAGWQLTASTVTGFIAKENVVASLAVMFATSEDFLHSVNSPLFGVFTPVSAFAFMLFNLFTPPCFAAIGAMNAEMESKRWLRIGLGFQFVTGYTLAMIVNQVGTLITTGKFADGFIIAIIILALEALVFVKLTRRSEKPEGTLPVAS